MNDKYKNEFGVFAARPQVEKKYYIGEIYFRRADHLLGLADLGLLSNMRFFSLIPP